MKNGGGKIYFAIHNVYHIFVQSNHFSHSGFLEPTPLKSNM
jgi:hypothetical protein